MSLDGGSSDQSLLHDIVSSLRHELDKLALSARKGAEWVRIPSEGIYAFINDFSAITPDESFYFSGADIPEVRVEEVEPADWDKAGTMASFSAGSEVAELREFHRKEGRGVRGRTGKESKEAPPAPSLTKGAAWASTTKLVEITEADYLKRLLKIRGETQHYHRWGIGGGKKRYHYWQKTPVRTGSKRIGIEGDVDAGVLDGDADTEPTDVKSPGSQAKKKEKRRVWSKADLRRYTVNCHPALARAMVKILAEPNGKEMVRRYMANAAPMVAAEFERVTGRKTAGLSIHFDSNMPHWNIWHSGIEKVICKAGEKEPDRIRYRRTALDFNASGPGLLAWNRVRRSYERQKLDFSENCKWTKKELDDAEKECKERQDRRPGDWTVNERADAVLEQLLVKDGWGKQVDAGFTEFVENEIKRYAAGMAGREAKNLKKIAGEMPLQKVQDLAGSLLELQHKVTKMEQAALKQEKELKGLRRLRELVVRFIDRLLETAKIAKLYAVVGRKAAEIFGLIGKETGRELPAYDKVDPNL